MHDLANLVIGGLSIPKKSLAVPYSASKSAHWQLEQTRLDIMQATKVSVSNNLLEHAVTASFMSPNKLFDILHHAIPPFESLWIEWDSAASIKYFGEFYEAKKMPYVADLGEQRCGYLVQKTVNGNYNYSQFVMSKHQLDPHTGEKLPNAKDSIYYGPCSIYVSHDPTIPKRQQLATNRRHNIEEWGRVDELWELGNNITFSQEKCDEFYSALLGTGYLKIHGSSANQSVIQMINQRIGISRHPLAYVSYQPMFNIPDRQQRVKTYYGGQVGVHEPEMMPIEQGKFHPVFWEMSSKVTLEMMAGDIRFLMCLIALWNYPNHVFERKTPKTENTGIKWGKTMPRNEVRTLDIALPKPEGVKIYEKMFKGFGTPKRQHLRRGHWRHLHKQDGTVQRTWIGEQVVGDPSLGIIDHNYNLKRN
tara:strand:+ start:862 stop:2118 length:1257 start_codon:yes stop_codon:yes gene_type:complete